MGDPTKFSSIYEYYAFNLAIISLLFSEIFIYFYTYSRKRPKISNRDRGTKWLLYFNFFICIATSFYLVSKKSPAAIRKVLLPNIFSYIGIISIFAGIFIRIWAVLTLKKAFTLNVQTTNEQFLVTNGLYHFIRHPAYTGSITSLLGIACSLKNFISVILVILCCSISYVTRMHIEETVLQEHFKEEYSNYKKCTSKLFPILFFKKLHSKKDGSLFQ